MKRGRLALDPARIRDLFDLRRNTRLAARSTSRRTTSTGRSGRPAGATSSCCSDRARRAATTGPRSAIRSRAAREWVRASGRGVVHTFSIVHQVFRPELAERVPYNVVVV
jgi:DUF35 OB-fold domain, acyl-CoA-associated